MIHLVDFEASGLDLNVSYPIEVGWATVDFEQKIVMSEGHLIAPVEAWTHWNEKSAQIHKISREDLTGGRSVVETAILLNKIFADNAVLCDGHRYDEFWAKRLYEAAGIERSWVLAPYKQNLVIALTEENGQWKKNGLKAYMRALERLKEERPHRASEDARILGSIFLAAVSRL